jgi:hypothetical protein
MPTPIVYSITGENGDAVDPTHLPVVTIRGNTTPTIVALVSAAQMTSGGFVRLSS